MTGSARKHLQTFRVAVIFRERAASAQGTSSAIAPEGRFRKLRAPSLSTRELRRRATLGCAGLARLVRLQHKRLSRRETVSDCERKL
jgi:hypothetical protein